MAYTKTNWTSSTPINIVNLNNIENGIEANDNNIGTLSDLTTPDKSSLVGAINSTVVESGTTTHGGYTKFSNGLMIEYGKIIISTKIDSQWGNMYEANVVLPNFPVAFNSLYSCNISTYGRACFIEYFNTTNSNIGNGYISRPTADSENYDYTFFYIAIGTWK